MAGPQNLFDRTALDRARARAQAAPGGFAGFLHEAAASEIEERLKAVNRSFTRPAVVAPVAAPWSRLGPVVADTEVLALVPGGHDLVIHGLCLHWAEDPVGQLIQCRRALAPDGLFIAALFGGTTLAELRAALAEAEAAVTGGLSPRVAPMAEIRDLGGLLQRAGFALPVADSLTTRVAYRDARHLMHDLRAMGETNALAARLRRPTRRAVFEAAERVYSRAFSTAEGRVRATFETIYLTGWAPAGTQPQPLRPGSAAARLADALGVPEMNPESERDA